MEYKRSNSYISVIVNANLPPCLRFEMLVCSYAEINENWLFSVHVSNKVYVCVVRVCMHMFVSMCVCIDTIPKRTSCWLIASPSSPASNTSWILFSCNLQSSLSAFNKLFSSFRCFSLLSHWIRRIEKSW